MSEYVRARPQRDEGAANGSHRVAMLRGRLQAIEEIPWESMVVKGPQIAGRVSNELQRVVKGRKGY